MMKKTPYLDFYKEYYGRHLPDSGLCLCLPADDKFINFITPTDEDDIELMREGYRTGYWGSGMFNWDDHYTTMYEFTPLRQTIILFMAAMNDEL